MKAKTKLKVVEIIDQSFLGGGQRHVFLLASRINPEIFEVRVCSSPEGPLVDQLKQAGVVHHGLYLRKRSPWKSSCELRDFLAREAFDLVHTHGGVAGLSARWAAFRAQVPVIVHTLHGIHYLHYRNPFLKWLLIWQERIMSQKTHKVVCVSEANAQEAIKYRLAPESKIVVIPNGLDWPAKPLLSPQTKKDKKLKLAQLFGLAPDSYFIGTVARLHRQKGLIYLFQAWPEVSQKIKQAVLLVVGGGPLEKKFRNYLSQKGWESQILLLGERDDVSEFYGALDLFVLPSLWEGLPLVLLEAAQWALPVVATDIDGCREVITSGETGLLVPPAQSGALAEAIIWMREHPQEARHWGVNLFRKASQRFSLQMMISRVEELYLELIQERGLKKIPLVS
ncbi:MAG: hypothetical protein DRJ11_04835 [Candidatus Aminicenantes bacterium]|nr:MAG: hypothetical protein DRJ11_04835 [Candidatus Aminicenantes bacterium]